MEEYEMILNGINESIQMLENMYKAGRLLNESELASNYTMRGLFYSQISMLDESIVDFNKAIEIMERMHREGKQFDENELAKAYGGRSITYFTIGELDRALPDLNNSIEIWERLQNSGKPIDKSMLFRIYALRGGMLNYISEYMDEALSDYRKSIKIAEDLKKAGEPFDEDGLASTYMGIAQSYDQKEEFSEANEYYNKCIEIWEQLRSEGQELEDEGNLALAYMNRGSNHYSLEKNDKALADYNKSITIMNSLEQDVFNMARVYKNRAFAHEVDGDIISAINDIMTALRILKEAFSEHPELQEYYYDSLNETIEWIADKNDNTLYNNILQEFLYSMCSVPKIEDAETAQNNLLLKLKPI